MNDHVDKPIEPEQLWAVLVRWLPVRESLASAADPPVARPGLTGIPDPTGQVPSAPECVDLAQGLRRAGGNQPLYLRMLSSFCASQAGAVDAIEGALARGDRDAAIRAAHTLKGLAGTIGAEALAQAAGVLEQRLVADEAALALRPPIAAAGAALMAVLAELHRHAARQAAVEPARPSNPAAAVDSVQAAALVAQLTALLQASSADAPDLLRQHADAFDVLLGERFARLRALVEGFDFEDAQELLKAGMAARDDRV